MGLFNKIKPLPIFLIAIFAMITACSSDNGSRVQVVDKSRSYRSNIKASTVPHTGQVVQAGNYAPVTKGQHVVQQGETLYSLAFGSGQDWRDLATTNNISAPYVIYPGQTIYLSGTNTSISTTKTHSKSSVKVTTSQQQTTKVSTTTPPPVSVIKPTTAVVGGWTWPAIGTVISTYSLTGTLNKGIDIAASEGTPVVAASAGTVVYTGNNLHGYGNLLIIKHNDSFVSAYGHNRVLLVKEGQKVKAGQKIAEMGSTAADRVKLHFEIRLNGKPVDPLKYLPKK